MSARPVVNRASTLVSVAVVALSLAACGGQGAGAPSAATPADPPTRGPVGTAATPGGTPSPTGAGRVLDPCALLTDEEITTATGFVPLSHEPKGGDGAMTPGCSWELDSGTPGITWGISLDVIDHGGRDYYDRFVAIEEGREPLPELGASASINDLGIVNVVDADTMVTLYYTQVPTPKGSDNPTIPLVKLVLDHVRAAPMS